MDDVYSMIPLCYGAVLWHWWISLELLKFLLGISPRTLKSAFERWFWTTFSTRRASFWQSAQQIKTLWILMLWKWLARWMLMGAEQSVGTAVLACLAAPSFYWQFCCMLVRGCQFHIVEKISYCEPHHSPLLFAICPLPNISFCSQVCWRS